MATNTWIELPGNGSGVTSLNGLTGAITLAAGVGISLGTVGNTITITNTGGSGTVTSVGLALPSIFTVSGSPVTTSGTLTGTLNTQTANLVFAGPSSGGAATPTFRALVSADIPNVTLSNTTISSSPVTILSTDTVSLYLVNTSAARTINLPAASTVANRRYIFKDSTGSAQTNNISIVPNGTDTIEGLNVTKVLQTNWGSWTLVNDGTSAWYMI